MEWRFYDDASRAVTSNLTWMNGRADAALASVQGTIASLGAFDPGSDASPASRFEMPAIHVPSAITPAAVSTIPFGTIDPWQDPAWEDVQAQVGISSDLVSLPGEFNPTTQLPTFRDAPDPIDTSGQPNSVNPPDPTIPSPPALTFPTGPTFHELTLPPDPGYTEAVFEGVRPVFEGVMPEDTWNWLEPSYAPRVLEDVVADLTRMLAGGTGLPTVVQDALFDAARSRESLTALAAVQQASDEWSARGFGMPPGMLVKAVDAVREKNSLAENALQREILTKAAVWEIENLRFSVEKGIALETMLHDWFEAAVKRTFEASKYHLEVEMKLYELAIAKLNADYSGYQTDAVVLRARIEAKLGTLQAWKARLDGELAKGQLDEHELKLYLGELDGVKAQIAIYSETMRGAEIHASINKSIRDGYATDVGAWGTLLKARMTAFEAYDSENRGKVAQTGAFEAEARAYAETVRAAEAEGNVKIKFVDANIAAMRASTEKYQAKLQAERERVQADLGVVQAQTSGFVADTGRYRAEIEGANQARGQEIQIAELRTRNLLAYYETQLKEYDASLARQIHRVELILDALKASGQFGAALAAGAMGAIHVQAGISGAGHVNDSVSTTHQYNHTVSTGPEWP